jgi:arabinofuranosyltransferase
VRENGPLGRIPLLLVLIVASLGLWIVVAKLVVPALIESAYCGESWSFLNRMISGQATHPVSEYIQDWDTVAILVLLGLVGFWLVVLVVSSPAFARRVVGARAFIPSTLWASPAILLATMGHRRRWVSEDAFIDLRIVRNLLDGHGPLFNINERVEAYTNPLWVALLAVWGWVGGRLEIGAVVLGMALSVAGIVMAQAGAGALASRLEADPDSSARGRIALPLGMLVFAAIPVVWDFVTSGLETGLAIGWLGLAFWLIVRARGRGAGARYLSAIVLGLGPLVRPDLAVFSLALFLTLALGEMGDARAVLPGGARLALAAAALPVAYQIFRMGYFAALVPNTALAKEAGAANWRQGWLYAKDFVGPYRLWIPLLLLLPWWVCLIRRAWRRRGWPTAMALVAPVLGALLHTVYVVRVGGDFMHGRFLLPTLLAALLPLASVTWVPSLRSPWKLAIALCLVVWAGVCATHLRVPYAGAKGPLGIADEQGVYTDKGRNNPVLMEDYASTEWSQWGASFRRFTDHRALFIDSPQARPIPLAPWVPLSTQTVVTFGNIGIFGYAAGPRVHVVDRRGLSDPIAARLRLESRGRPGHEKVLPHPWAVARFADPETTRRMYPVLAPAVENAREALRCGSVAALLRAIEDPLTPGRFLGNIRLAWTLRDLRIAPDPLAARAALCAS